jgi:uncharacterized protein YutE (UPF0331/DUF86 family)
MVDGDVVTAKLAELTRRLSRIRDHRPATSSDFAADSDALDLVSFNLMLAVQTSLDLASHIIADEGWEPATTLAGSFRRMNEHGVISKEVAAALGRAAGLRNLVAHGYAEVDLDLLYVAATDGLLDLERFSSEVSDWVRARLAE